MGKKGRKKEEDYWESDAFMEDLEGVDPAAPQSVSESDESAKGPGKKGQQQQKGSQEDGELDVSANQKGKNKKQQQQNKKGGAQTKKPQAEAGNVGEEGVEQQGEKTSEQQQKGASLGKPGQQKKQQQQGQKKPVKQGQKQEPQQKDQEPQSLNAAGDSTKEKDDAGESGESATDGEKSANDGNVSATNEKTPLTAAQKKRLKQQQKKAAPKQQEPKPQQPEQKLDDAQESNQTAEKTNKEDAPASVNEAEIASPTKLENENPQAASDAPEVTESKPLTAAQKKRLKQKLKKEEEKRAAEKLVGSAATTISASESPSVEAGESTKEITDTQSAGTAADNDASASAAETPADESDSTNAAAAGGKQLTAAQKKRLKLKQKKEAAKQADSSNAQANAALLGGKSAAPAGKKPVKKGPGAAIAALIKAQKEEEERIKKLIEEQERLAEEQRKKEEEEERRQQELIELKKKQKKEKAKARKQTAGERKRKQEMELAKKRLMMVEGVNFPNVDENRANTAPTSLKKQFKKDKKKAGENNEAETNSGDAAQGGQRATANQTVESGQETQKDDADDWEKLADSENNEEDWEKVVEKKVDAKPATPPVAAPVVLSPEEQKKKEEQDKKAQEKAAAEAKKKAEEDEKKRIEETRAKMRSPICCVLGHVDSGKTSLLDKIRRTTVQAGEAGGITQQIGASYFPIEEIIKQTRELVRDQDKEVNFNIPGLLIMDTPGHECFSNLRARGSSLCDIAILVVNILEGLKPQTIESIQLLRTGKTPFVVALNKIDKLFEWKSTPNCSFQKTFAKQAPHVQRQFQDLTIKTITQLAEQGLNSALYYENKDYKRNVSIVPTSAHTAEGLPDLLLLMTQLTQQMMASRFLLSDQLQASVLEVKVVEGLGTTIDAIITDGELKEGDTIVCCGLSGPIVANIRSLLTPHPLKDIRTKTPYIKQKRVKAAMGVKIAAQGLDEAVAGSALLVYHPKIDDLEAMKNEVQKDLNELLKSISCDEGGRGVFVQASTLGSLEALLKFLKEKSIPVAGVNIGPVHKRDVVRASVMLEKDKVYAVILAFDVKIDREAQSFAAKEGVQIFCADVIYHLEEIFLKYMEDIENQRKESSKASAVWPCVLEIYPEHIFRTKDPITVGIKVLEGTARIGTPLVIRPGEPNELEIGKILSLEENHQQKEIASKGSSISCSIAPTITVCTYGRQFDAKDRLYSKISRGSIEVLKEHFAKEVTPEDRILIAKLKKSFHIP